ncbi:uncharacterized protein [Aegilops tauschii subsp. strangulata]|uniref:uncharacterized protein n=1 Tax=Aegilops tauschii subsp. strangulata TaxID=200361 RepID=UPI001ABC5A98
MLNMIFNEYGHFVVQSTQVVAHEVSSLPGLFIKINRGKVQGETFKMDLRLLLFQFADRGCYSSKTEMALYSPRVRRVHKWLPMKSPPCPAYSLRSTGGRSRVRPSRWI